jgi:carboxypeptidase C (cathepsin A)
MNDQSLLWTLFPVIDKTAPCSYSAHMLRTIILFLSLTFLAFADEKTDKSPAPKSTDGAASESLKSVTKKASVQIDGKKIPYKVTSGKIQLKGDDGKARASIFHVSYEREDVPDRSKRPVMFAFNGGPGSSSVWLHIGVLGPRILNLEGDGTRSTPPPLLVSENPQSILDVCDLVFVDPVSTGYSRAENEVKPGDFHGLNQDIESLADFVRMWVSTHDRWASPKHLLGESYGGMRVAGLSKHLQSRYGMHLNGVILLSSLLDFATVAGNSGSEIFRSVYLPSYTAVAHFHGKLEGDRDKLVAESTQFAYGEYASALIMGSSISPDASAKIASKLESLTSIPAATWQRHRLRIDPTEFRAELLRKEGKFIGRFDARVTADAGDETSQEAKFDPSYSLAYGAFSSAMMDYLGRDLGYDEDQPYEIITSKVAPWRWDAENTVVSVADRLSTAMRDNPHLKVLVMSGHNDLATPPESMAQSLRQMLDLPQAARSRIRTEYYEGGHMFYLNPADLKKTRVDLVKFLTEPSK